MLERFKAKLRAASDYAFTRFKSGFAVQRPFEENELDEASERMTCVNTVFAELHPAGEATLIKEERDELMIRCRNAYLTQYCRCDRNGPGCNHPCALAKAHQSVLDHDCGESKTVTCRGTETFTCNKTGTVRCSATTIWECGGCHKTCPLHGSACTVTIVGHEEHRGSCCCAWPCSLHTSERCTIKLVEGAAHDNELCRCARCCPRQCQCQAAGMLQHHEAHRCRKNRGHEGPCGCGCRATRSCEQCQREFDTTCGEFTTTDGCSQ